MSGASAPEGMPFSLQELLQKSFKVNCRSRLLGQFWEARGGEDLHNVFSHYGYLLDATNHHM
jgi:hypothetical protein